MNYNDHAPSPHFHARYGGDNAAIEIELLANWQLARQEKRRRSIEPLR
jgi:hypothetical protein